MMTKKDKGSVLHAIFTQIGFIIGLGIFSVPYVLSRSGLAVGIFWIIVLGITSLAINLFYGAIIDAVPGHHRLVGYAEALLGKRSRYIVTAANVVSSWATMIAYTIVGGTFLYALLGYFLGGSEFVYSMVFWIFMAFLIARGIRMVDGAEFFMTALLLLVMAVLIYAGFSHIRGENLIMLGQEHFFFPYGVILFSLGGAGAVPSMYDIVGRKKRLLTIAIVVGVVVSVILTTLFAVAVLGASGAATTAESFTGLQGIVGSPVIVIGELFGILAIMTSFIVLGLNLTDMFRYDFKIPRISAWFLALTVPLLLYVFKARNFIHVIDLNGSVFLAIDNVIIIVLFLTVMERYPKFKRYKNILTTISFVLMIVFMLGAMEKLIRF